VRLSDQTSVPPCASTIVGFDPGRDKCGVAVVDLNRSILAHQVVPAATVLATLTDLRQQYNPQRLVMGNQTTAKQWRQQLEATLMPPLPITFIDERYSTLEARDRYWVLYPPKGLERLIPQGMRTVPRPIDDIVAIILVERYLAQQPEP
jgi:RNase H-fold protein (predicted Holliday junction resolvase)